MTINDDELIKICHRTCLNVMVVLAAVDDSELSRFVVEQLTRRHCG